jgi:hypothetical protein
MTVQAELSKIVRNSTFNKIISIESAGRPKAKAPTSSAGGLFQFLYATFYEECRIHQPALLKGRTKQQVYALRFDPETAIEIGVKFTEDNANALGRGWTEGDLYLAHFLGIGTAKGLLRAPSSAWVVGYVSQAAINANKSILTDKTCGQVRKWAQMAMDTRWMHLGNPDWIGIWYHKDDTLPIPPIEVIAKNAAPLAHKAEGEDGHLVDIDGNGIPDYLERVPFEIPHGEFAPVPASRTAADEEDRGSEGPLRRPSVVVIAGEQATVQGDPDVWLVANVLKSMHYAPGTMDGKWGGMLAGAIGGFVNDRAPNITVPRSPEEFAKVKAVLLDALAHAQDDMYVRPVSQERAHASDEKVKEVAPESAPAKRGFWVTLSGAIASAFAAVGTSVSGWVGDAWEWLHDNEDKIPDEAKDPSKVMSWIHAIPVGVWFAVIGGILLFVAIGNWQVFAKIREDVKTGMRK